MPLMLATAADSRPNFRASEVPCPSKMPDAGAIKCQAGQASSLACESKGRSEGRDSATQSRCEEDVGTRVATESLQSVAELAVPSQNSL